MPKIKRFSSRYPYSTSMHRGCTVPVKSLFSNPGTVRITVNRSNSGDGFVSLRDGILHSIKTKLRPLLYPSFNHWISAHCTERYATNEIRLTEASVNCCHDILEVTAGNKRDREVLRACCGHHGVTGGGRFRCCVLITFTPHSLIASG